MTPSTAQRVRGLVSGLEAVNEWVGRAVAWLALAMVAVMALVVLLRYAFDMGWIALQESTSFMHGLLFMLAAAYTLKHEGHVRVDIFYQRFSARRQAVVNLLGALLLLLPTAVFIFVMSWDYVLSSWTDLESSYQTGGLPGVFLLKTALLVLPALLALQGAAQILRSVLVLSGEED